MSQITTFNKGLLTASLYRFIIFDRVTTDLENLEKSGNLKDTSDSQEICLKSQGICDRIPKVREFCCLKFIFGQVEHPKFADSRQSLILVWKSQGKVGEKSGNFILSGKWQPCFESN